MLDPSGKSPGRLNPAHELYIGHAAECVLHLLRIIQSLRYGRTEESRTGAGSDDKSDLSGLNFATHLTVPARLSFPARLTVAASQSFASLPLLGEFAGFFSGWHICSLDSRPSAVDALPKPDNFSPDLPKGSPIPPRVSRALLVYVRARQVRHGEAAPATTRGSNTKFAVQLWSK